MINVTGHEQVMRNLRKLGVDVERAVKEAVSATAQGVRGTAVKSIQKRSYGHPSKRQRQGGGTYTVIASKPGDPPNTDTGRLVNSIAVEPMQPATTMYVGTSVEYGRWLEFGTGTMAERPWLQPALQRNEKVLTQQLTAAIQRQIDKAAE